MSLLILLYCRYINKKEKAQSSDYIHAQIETFSFWEIALFFPLISKSGSIVDHKRTAYLHRKKRENKNLQIIGVFDVNLIIDINVVLIRIHEHKKRFISSAKK